MPDYKQLIRGKIGSRKMSQVTPKPKKVLSKIVSLLIVGTLIVGASFGARSFLLHFSGFKIGKVSIVNVDGKALENPEDIFRLDGDFNLFSFDIERVVQDIQARHPQLHDVFIRKQFPNELLIVVKERDPVAIIILRDSYLVDEEGFVLPFKSIYRDSPKIIGIHPKQIQLYARTHSLRLKKALNLLKELKKAKIYPEYKVSQIDVRRYSNVIFYLENRIEVKMGQSDFGRKTAVLRGILVQLKSSDTVPKYIDMRFGDPVVKP